MMNLDFGHRYISIDLNRLNCFPTFSLTVIIIIVSIYSILPLYPHLYLYLNTNSISNIVHF